MSAPDTDIDKQQSHHKPALLSIKGAVVFGVLMIIIMVFYVISNGSDDTARAVVNTEQAIGTDASVAPVDPITPGTNESN